MAIFPTLPNVPSPNFPIPSPLGCTLAILALLAFAPTCSAQDGPRSGQIEWPGTKMPVQKRKTLPVLPPSNFFGKAKTGYQAAKESPDVCGSLFCYCGCDLTDDHNTLLDCFTSDHGVDCHICQEEALVGLKMKKQGKSLGEIQKAIDIIYEKEYPFDDVSPYLKEYRKERLWSKGNAAINKLDDQPHPLSKEFPATETKKGAPSNTPAQKKNTKPSASTKATHKGSCCGHGKKTEKKGK